MIPLKSNRLLSCDWSPASNLIAFSDGATQEINIWNPTTNLLVTKISSRGRPITEVAFSESADKIEVGFSILPEGEVDLSRKGLTHVFDYTNLQLRKIKPEETGGFHHTHLKEKFLGVRRGAKGTPEETKSLILDDGGKVHLGTAKDDIIRDWSYSIKGDLLVAHDRGLTLYQATNRNIEKRFQGHESSVRSVASSSDGKYLVSGSEDRTVRLWNLETGALLVSLFVGDPETDDWVCWTPDGYFNYIGNGDDYVGWHINNGPGKLADFLGNGQLFQKFYDPDLIKQIIREGKKTTVASVKASATESPKLTPPEPPLPVMDISKANEEAPSVEIVGITNGQVADNQLVNLEVKAINHGSDITSVDLFFHNKAVEYEGPPRNLGKDVIVPFQVSLLSGANEFKAVATNADGVESKPVKVIVEYTGEIATGKLHILAVGLNDYYNDALDLRYCLADAQGLLSRMEINSKGLFLESNSIEIYDAKAKKESILKAFENVASACRDRPQDTFIFIFAGHGAMADIDNDDVEEFHLIPYDVGQVYGDPEGLKKKAVSGRLLGELCATVEANKQFLVIDACQSGGVVEGFQLASRGASTQKALATLARSSGTMILTSTGKDKFAREAEDLGHGLFSYSVLKGLEGKADLNGDSQIKLSELNSWVNDNLPELSAKYTGKVQVPTYYANGSDFPIGLISSPTVSQK